MKKLTLAVLCALAGLTAQAAQVTSLPGGTVLAMPALNYFGTGPQNLAPGVDWSSAYNYSVFGYTGGYGFADNGSWSGLSMAGTNDSTSTMVLAFTQAVSGVGAFFNYAPHYFGPATIAVYDASSNLIESTTLTFTTNGGTNQGEFHGFLENTATISYFTMTGAYMGATDFTVVAVPEPETYGMLLVGLGLLGVAARRRKA